jgi:esterase/lipase superfamily enzyme
MGNRALIKALQGFPSGHHSLSQPMGSLTNIIFVAADETRTEFEKMLTSLCIGTKSAKDPLQITVYSSLCDMALHMSKMIHWKVRLGDTRSLFGDDSMMNPPDVVDASGVDASRLHHSYYGDVPEVIKDIQDLLTPFSAKERTRGENAVIKPVSYKDKLFYAFEPSSRLQKVFHSLIVL